jgi:uncharacterized membrane protein
VKVDMSVDSRAVVLLLAIQSRWNEADRMPETDDYRRGWREGLMGLQNGREADELRAALTAAGWTPPGRTWAKPDPLAAATTAAPAADTDAAAAETADTGEAQ